MSAMTNKFKDFSTCASDNDQSMYFARAYGILEANPELKTAFETLYKEHPEASYNKTPINGVAEELWDIDNGNPEPRYTILKDIASKNKFKVPIDIYSGKPETDLYKNVIALGKQLSSPEQIQDLEKEFGTQGDNSDTGTPYQSREEVPEQARELWDIMHGLRDDPHDDRWED